MQRTANTSAQAVITPVGDARWASFHLFPLEDLDALLVQVVRPVVAELWAEGVIDRFFFIRYPEGGAHVRLRLRIGPGREPRPAAERALALLQARCAGRSSDGAAAPPVAIVPAELELEIERYGGPRFYPHGLAFFSLSSMNALGFVEAWRGQSRARQLVEILVHLGQHAVGLARTETELRELADYAVQWRSRMAPIVARADRMFEERGPSFTDRIRQVLVSAARAGPAAGELAPGSPEAHVAHARCLAAALCGLEGERRWQALGSQLHMAANRLGLGNPEEVYLSAILCRSLDALGDELAGLVRAATSIAAPAPGLAGLAHHGPGASAGQALDALIEAAMRALFGPSADSAPGSGREGAP